MSKPSHSFANHGSFSSNEYFLSGGVKYSNATLKLSSEDTLLNRFTIKKTLYNGRVNAVFIAKDLLTSTDVILKIIDIGPRQDNPGQQQLRHEMEINNMLTDFEHIIRFNEIHITPYQGTYLMFLSMGYAKDGSFRDWLLFRKKQISERQRAGLDYFIQVCLGVAALHKDEIVHLDLKPENFLVVDDVVKISDFATAFSFKSQNYCPANNGIVPGRSTSIYMSPEYCSASYPDQIDYRADIYSLGVILYELMHPECRPPFSGDDERVEKCHRELPVPPLPDTDELIVKIVYRCMAKNPKERFKDISELLTILGTKSSRSSRGYVTANSPSIHLKEMIGKLLKATSQSLSEMNFYKARCFIQQILKISPHHVAALDVLNSLNIRYREAEKLYQSAENNLDKGDLGESESLIRDAMAIYPEHPCRASVRSKFNAKVKQFHQATRGGVVALQGHDYIMAASYFYQALTFNSGASYLRPVLAKLSILINLRRDIDKEICQGNNHNAKRMAYLADSYMDELKKELPYWESLKERIKQLADK